ncbi:MAG: hypothetical protein E7513_06585 [Ruminococcaceae bacterium]|nr:hypothetical protein [Oscillospiraceae bacterium]
MKKLVSLLLVLITLFTVFASVPFSASAATTGFDILSSQKYAKVYTLKNTGNTIPYTTSKLSTRGSVTYGKSSSAYIANSSDELYLQDVGTTNGKTWAKVSYPVGSKRAVAYIALSAITTNNASHKKVKSIGKFYCAPRITSSTSSSYYVSKGDTTYLIATDGNKYQILYPTSGGLYRIGWCSKSDYNKYCGTPVSSVALNKTSVSLTGKGVSTTLSTTIKPTDATDKTITWKSSNTNVAKVSSSGKVTSVGIGTATITATSSNGKSAKATVTVKSKGATAVSLSSTSFTLKGKGATKTLTATMSPSTTTDKVSWKTSNSKVATVSDGKVTAVAKGTATITATTTSGKKATANVTVSIIPATKVKLSATSCTLSSKGATKTITATMTPSNTTDKITWSSSNKSVATVSTSGKITAVANGTAKITAKATSGKTATVNVTCSIKSTGFDYPMKNIYCTWNSPGNNMSWGSINSSRSASRNRHLGIDVWGTNGYVYACADGEVVDYSTSPSGGGLNGRYITIKHKINGTTVYSFYAHLASVDVKSGKKVSKGDKIGVAGGSGNGINNYYGKHLHFAFVNKYLDGGNYYGYAPSFSGNKVSYGGFTFYNPVYVVKNDKLP